MGVLSGILAGYLVIRTIDKGSKEKHKVNLGSQMRVAQNLPGRLRIYAEGLKNRKKANEITVQLIRIDGIKHVKFNEVTGSMLIEYDASKIQDDLLIAAMFKLLEMDLEMEKPSKSLVAKEIQTVNQALNYAVLDKTKGLLDLRTLMPLTFIFLAVKEFYTTRKLGTPAPVTLLYWAYNSLGLGGNSE